MNTKAVRWLLWKVARLFKKPEITFEPSATRPEFSPGDYRKQNAVLLEQTDGHKIYSQLWLAEAKDSENPIRQAECMDLAAAHQRVYELQKAFYSRWHIPEE